MIDNLIAAAKQYNALGLETVPLDGKKPNVRKWPRKNWPGEELRPHLDRAKEPGLGVKMGPIIDFESDSAQQLQGIRDLFGGEIPHTAHFESKNGGHYLFRNDPRLEGLGDTIYLDCGERPNGKPKKTLVVRSGPGAQSAFPPSPDKVWTVPIDNIQPLPESVVQKLLEEKKPAAQQKARQQAKDPKVHEAALMDMLKIERGQEQDGSNTVFKCAIRTVEHDLPDEQAVATIQAYLVQRPTPKDWTDEEILARIRQAEARDDVERGSRVGIRNFLVVGDNKLPTKMTDLIEQVPTKLFTVNGMLCAHDRFGVCELATPAALFGLLKRYMNVQWGGGLGMVSQNEFYEELTRTAPGFDTVQDYPHYPLVPNVYYVTGTPQPGNKLDELLSFFRPSSELDRLLIKAAIVTQCWGGPCGSRPLIVITSPDGQGAGKTAAAELICEVGGGGLMLKPAELPKFTERLFSSKGQNKRSVILDNIRSDNFKSADLEQYVTAQVISGKKLFVGEGRMDNILNWYVTLNGPSLGKDIAQRAVIAEVVKGPSDPGWLQRSRAFVAEHREAIIGDCLEILRQSPRPMDLGEFRWGPWAANVLSKMDRADTLLDLILDRQRECDADAEEAAIIADAVSQEIGKRGFDPDKFFGRIPAATLAQWVGNSTGSHVTTTKLAAMLRQTPVAQLSKDPSRTHGRCYRWRGSDSAGDISNELLDANSFA